MKVTIWITEGTWEAAVDAARDLAPADADLTLLHVTDEKVTAAAHHAYTGLLGRGHRERDPGVRLEALSQAAAAELLEAAAARLGRAAAPRARHPRRDHAGVRAAEGAHQ
ncbi:hypothetical protein, partial [Actinoallomurus sp. NPDC052274]|uniref:hypothetical protein n=1 Tax=Actinoallomurus sp. NPDC052274 TaxID=3155420 RepID=UPI00342F3CCD